MLLSNKVNFLHITLLLFLIKYYNTLFKLSIHVFFYVCSASGGGWRVAGRDNVHVDSVFLQERRWVAGAREKGYDNERY